MGEKGREINPVGRWQSVCVVEADLSRGEGTTHGFLLKGMQAGGQRTDYRSERSGYSGRWSTRAVRTWVCSYKYLGNMFGSIRESTESVGNHLVGKNESLAYRREGLIFYETADMRGSAER